jgi:hypothetical protein
MSSVAAETIVDLDLKDVSPVPSSLPFYALSPTLKTSEIQEQDLKNPSYFDHEYATEAGPSSAGLEEQGFFNDLPILEKGNNHLDSTPIPLTPFVLDESYFPRAEGGWAGWTCVAGSWLVCMSLPLDSADCVVFATAGYANAFGVCAMLWVDDGKLINRFFKRTINSLGIRMNLLLVSLGLVLFNGSSSTSASITSPSITCPSITSLSTMSRHPLSCLSPSRLPLSRLSPSRLAPSTPRTHAVCPLTADSIGSAQE